MNVPLPYLTKPPYGTLSLQQLIGRGSYGHIYKAYSSLQSRHYAVKVISPDTSPECLTSIQRQISILLSCSHENVVKCHSVEIVGELVWIVMDYHQQGSLADVMARRKRVFGEPEINSILSQVVKALVYLHGKNIIHRDIKAANILMDDQGVVKVADFGVSTLLTQTHAGRNTRTGSPLWMSPELLSNSNYTFKTDIWSLGITALELAEGVPPYSHQHPYRAIFSIQSNPPRSLTQPSRWSPAFNGFVSRCLCLDVNRRPSAVELLNHEFFTQTSRDPEQDFKKVRLVGNLITNEQTSSGLEELLHQTQQISNIGTVVLHESTENRSISSSLKQSQPRPSYHHGTFHMISECENMEPNLLAAITKAMPAGHSQQSCHAEEDLSIESLYREMEEEIMKVRKRYLTRIRALEEANTMTFSQQLKKVANRPL